MKHRTKNKNRYCFRMKLGTQLILIIMIVASFRARDDKSMRLS